MDSYFVTGNQIRYKRRSKRKSRTVIVFLFCIVVISLFFFFIDQKRKWDTSKIISPLAHASGAVVQNKAIPTQKPEKKDPLQEVVENAMEGTDGTYAILIRNIKTKERYALSEHLPFDTGSLYKLWVMAVVYKQIQSGTFTEDQVLRQDIQTLNREFDIDLDYAELTDGVITLTIADALTQMITISHNYAALLLTEKIGLSSIAAFLNENGFRESVVGSDGDNPTSTAFDISLFFEKLYAGAFANEEYTKEMIELLKKQQLNKGLPKYLPFKTEVANKTGDLDYFKHDAGIVFTDNGDYIIVVLSKTDNPAAAQEQIARLSQKVFEYFTKVQ